MDRTLRGAQAYSRRTAGVHQSHSKSVLLSAFKTLCLSFSGENGVAMTKPISASFSGAIGVIETCGRRIGSEPRKRVVRKGTSRFQFVPVCGKREQTGTLMGAGRFRVLCVLSWRGFGGWFLAVFPSSRLPCSQVVTGCNSVASVISCSNPSQQFRIIDSTGLVGIQTNALLPISRLKWAPSK